MFGVFSVENMFPSLGWIDVLTGLHKRMKRAREAIHHFLDEDMFVAGTDTPTLEWVMVELVIHPNVIKQIKEEVRPVVGTNSEVDEDEMAKMDYL
ncbi:hypothetical protein IFM89_033762 [Coptis chinensis]|uniref:Cytochrome P450 n=1 Tax=Coptis chinensis TaxID=261450 RepID=A0A835LSB1_9MAGN|nr:hypothetical protein IFM89_033762 [Coptis chinensis]